MAYIHELFKSFLKSFKDVLQWFLEEKKSDIPSLNTIKYPYVPILKGKRGKLQTSRSWSDGNQSTSCLRNIRGYIFLN
jgi:hypothetical protein